MSTLKQIKAVVLDWAGTTVDHGSRAPAMVFQEIFRELLEKELGAVEPETSLLERTRRFIGSVRDRRAPAGRDARKALEDWRPDRRG